MPNRLVVNRVGPNRRSHVTIRAYTSWLIFYVTETEGSPKLLNEATFSYYFYRAETEQ